VGFIWKTIKNYLLIVWMKSELHRLKVHLHLAKRVLHLHNIFINCVDEARAWPAEDPPSSCEAHASSGQYNKLYSTNTMCEAELDNVMGSACTKSAVH